MSLLNESRFLPSNTETLFAAVDKAYKLLLDPEHKKRVVDVIHAGKEYIEHNVRAFSVTPYKLKYVSQLNVLTEIPLVFFFFQFFFFRALYIEFCCYFIDR